MTVDDISKVREKDKRKLEGVQGGVEEGDQSKEAYLNLASNKYYL